MFETDHEDVASELEPVAAELAPHEPIVDDDVRPFVDFEPLAADLDGAVDAAGPEETAAAIAQVQRGHASPDALVAWIDDLRDPEGETTELVDPADEQTGVIADFLADTQIANAAAEGPPGVDDDYLYSAARRRRRAAEPTAPDDDEHVERADHGERERS